MSGDPTDVIPYLLVEVTVGAAFIGVDGAVVGDNVADATLQFGWRADNLPTDADDPFVQEALRRQLGPVLANVQLTMTAAKWAFLGPIDKPALAGGTDTGIVMETDPITVRIPMVSDQEARA